ncbi:MAG: ankyrin repeat domain-containing protein [Acidobacteriota bacterium]|nr:ankyrin repeat domain-containing protein [Acidobacteriota bacterium]
MRIVASMVALVFSTSAGLADGQDLRLVSAAAAQDHRTVRTLVEQGLDVNAARADGATALLWAAHWDDSDAVAMLLHAGANVNAADDHGVTPLERAAENVSVPMVQMLLAAGANPNSSQTSGLTPLMTAARTGSVEVVEALLAYGAEVNAATTATRSTALMWAVSESHHGVARLLLSRGAAPGAATADGFTPLLLAAAAGDIALAETLLAAGIDVNETGSDETHVLPYAIVNRQDTFALFLLEHGADPNGSMGGVSALHAAAGSVGTWLHDWSRRHGGDPGYLRGGIGRTALVADRRVPLVKALLARGARPNTRITTSAMFMSYIGYPTKGAFEPFSCGTGDVRGATPLWVAAYASNRGENTEILRALLAAGADHHLRTDDGTTPLMAAAGLGRCTYRPREPRGSRSPSAEQAMRVLVEAGADVNAVNEADFRALHGAAFRGLNEVIAYLVERGAAVDARDFRGRTAFRMAEGAKQSFQFQSWPETAALLAALGADTHLGIPGTIQERLRDVPIGADLPR